jgi:hypothetical protein
MGGNGKSRRLQKSQAPTCKAIIDTGNGSCKFTLHWLYLSESTSNTPRLVDVICGRDGVSWVELSKLFKATVYMAPTVGTNLKRKANALNDFVLDLYSLDKKTVLNTTVFSPAKQYAFRIKWTVAAANKHTNRYTLKLKERARTDRGRKAPQAQLNKSNLDTYKYTLRYKKLADEMMVEDIDVAVKLQNMTTTDSDRNLLKSTLTKEETEMFARYMGGYRYSSHIRNWPPTPNIVYNLNQNK